MAATTHTWISTTGIWSSAASWNTAQIPGVGGAGLDTALFNGTSNVSVIGETPGGATLARIVTKPAYKGNIGAPGNPLVLEINSPGNNGEKAVFRGRGNVYFKGAGGNFADVVIDTDTFDRVVSLDGPLRHVFVKSGKVELVSTVASFTSFFVLSSNCMVTIEGDAASMAGNATLTILGGTVDSKEDDWPRIEMFGGHLIQRGLLKDGVDVTLRGGWLEYKPTLSISGHNPDLHLVGGTFDLRALTEDLTAADLVRGADVDVLGNLLGQGTPGGSAIVIDLREDYP